MKYYFLSGDVNYSEYGGKWISSKNNNGEFDYYFVIELLNMNEYERNPDFTYMVTLNVCVPEWIDADTGEVYTYEAVKNALESWGMTFEDLPDDPKAKTWLICDALHSNGIAVQIEVYQGNNYKLLISEAKTESKKVNMLFGFYMDRAVNRIGTSGWELIRGDLLAGLNRF